MNENNTMKRLYEEITKFVISLTFNIHKLALIYSAVFKAVLEGEVYYV